MVYALKYEGREVITLSFVIVNILIPYLILYTLKERCELLLFGVFW